MEHGPQLLLVYLTYRHQQLPRKIVLELFAFLLNVLQQSSYGPVEQQSFVQQQQQCVNIPCQTTFYLND